MSTALTERKGEHVRESEDHMHANAATTTTTTNNNKKKKKKT